jgi:hypothetical protein
MKLAETSNELRVRNGNEALCVERALAQERNRNSHFEPGSTNARGVRDERDERAILVARWHAEHQGRPHLGGEAQVNEPHLTPTLGQPSLALATIQFEEDVISCAKQLVVAWALVWRRGGATEQLEHDLVPLARRKLFEGIEHALGPTAHGSRLPLQPAPVKRGPHE